MKDKQQNPNSYIKPPIGVLPKYINDSMLEDEIIMHGGVSEGFIKNWKIERLSDIQGAVKRYIDANMHVDQKWLDEYQELIDELGFDNRKPFKL